ncbi:hypothetical protein, partial [Klebsiella pneumoniae]|uniref:hypothetical protein n=1 Tax=Klebsiella pneumoniae TaxID=573 RepID=UPI003012DFD8
SGTTVVGTAVTSGVVANGKASAQYVLPGGSGAGTYKVVASYSDVGANFQSADNSAGPAQLTVAQAASATSADSISVAAPTFQPVILSATI